MRNPLLAIGLSVALGFACLLRAQTTDSRTAATGETKTAASTKTTGTTPDFTGVWRRVRRPPDNKRKYTLFEIALSLTNEQPPLTPWGLEKFKAAKPNVGPHAVPLAQTNDPTANCFLQVCPKSTSCEAHRTRFFRSPGAW